MGGPAAVGPKVLASGWQRLVQLKAMLLTSGATATSVGLSIARTKIVAELLGPAGTAVLSQLANIGGVAGVLATIGIPAAIVQRVSAADGRGERDAAQKTVATAAMIFMALAVLVAGLQIVATPWLASLLGGVADGPILLAIVAASLPTSALAVLMTSSLNGRRLTRATVTAGVVGAAVAAALTFPLVAIAGLQGGAIALMATGVGSAAYGLVALRRQAPELFESLRSPLRLSDRDEARALIHFGVPSVLAGFIPLGMQLVARTIVINEAGMEQAGLFQAALAFSHQYAGLFLGSLGVYLMPLLAATRDADELSRETERSLLLLLEIGTPILLIAIAAYDIVLPLAYSHRFLGAGEQLQIQLAADVAKIASWHFGVVLIARGRTRAFLFVEVFGAAAFLSLISAFIRPFPQIAGGIAFAGTYVSYFFVTYWVAWRSSGVRLSWRGWRGLLLATLAAGAGLAAALAFGRSGRMVVGAAGACALLLFLRRLAASGALRSTPLGRFFKERT